MIVIGVMMSIASKFFGKLHGGAGNRPSLDAMLEMFDRELDNFQSLVPPSPESQPRTPFDSPHLPIEKMSTANMSKKQLASALPMMLPLILQMRASSKLYDGKFKPTQTEASPEFIKTLENMARTAGAKDIQYVKVPRNAIFQHKGIPHEYAIIFTVEMDQETDRRRSRATRCW